MARKITPRAYVARLDRMLANAGRPASMPLDRCIDSEAAGGAGRRPRWACFLEPPRARRAACWPLDSRWPAISFPICSIYNSGTKRQARIGLDLPNVLDQLLDLRRSRAWFR